MDIYLSKLQLHVGISLFQIVEERRKDARSRRRCIQLFDRAFYHLTLPQSLVDVLASHDFNIKFSRMVFNIQ